MTAHAPQSALSLHDLAPNVTAKVRDGDLAKAQLALLAIGAGLVGAAWLTVGGKNFYFAYLVGYMGVLGICLGALFFTMVQHITRAGWSVVVRRTAENIAGALPLMAVLFVPVLLGAHDLFHHWMEPKAGDEVLAGKSAWLNANFFYARAAIYFAIWVGLAAFFRSQSIKQDASGDPAISLRLARVAAPGLLLFALSTSFAAFDWIMSLDPHWFSTIFGITYFAGGVMAFFAFTILLLRWLGTKGYLKDAVTTEHFHDLGKFLFAFMVFWTYTNFSQYMLIWYANLPEETAWYAHRAHHGWSAVGTLLILGHFFVPFAFLMSRHVKRNPIGLAVGAVFMLVIHGMDMQYLILPNLGHGEAAAPAGEVAHADFAHAFGEYLHTIGWADFGCYVGLLALLGGFVLLNVRRTNLVPVRDPRLAESLHFHNI
ncbi:MAG: hypothetical protein ACK5S5_03760 [Planctomycetota bacterium]|jgi:hypothetical protein